MFRRPRAREPARAGLSEGSRSAADAPAGPGGQPSAPTLAHQWTLELGQRPEHVEHQAAAAVAEAIEGEVGALLEQAHAGTGGKPVAPPSASKASVNVFTRTKPALATVQGNYRLTAQGAATHARELARSSP